MTEPNSPTADTAPADPGPDRQAQPVDAEQPPRLPFPVVGIGASAGGLEAVSEFLEAMRPDAGLAFILVQHLPPDRESLMAEILGRRTRMPVRQVEDGMAVEPDHVYVIRPGHVLTLRDGRLHLGPQLGSSRAANRPIDDFFKSLAEEQRELALCVILSGMGSNGTAGAQTVKAVGGLCVAQDPETAQFPSMPRHLIDAGYADYVLRPAEIPDALLTFAGSPYAQGGREADAHAVLDREQQHLREILAILRTRTRRDFSGYKKPTVLRRVQRRMGLTRVSGLVEYARQLRQSPSEVTALADDLLIHVSGFFRDPQAWAALRERVIVPLVAAREIGATVRAWVTACSSGEEAYSLAMLLAEESDLAGKQLDIKVFATDLAERPLANARAGVYPGGIESEVSPEQLARFFVKDDEIYRARQELRDRVVFAPQNILQDPPFSRLDIATCRNLLIYLEPEVQQQVLSLLHFGLRDGGTLFLGTAETITGTEDMFEPLDKRARIYRRVGPTRHGAVDFALPHLPPAGDGTTRTRGRRHDGARSSVAELTQRALLEHHTPAAVTVDRDQRVLYFHGDTRPYLLQPTGEPTRDLMLLVRDGVRGAVRAAIGRAAAQNAPAVEIGGWMEPEPGRRVRVAVTASPVAATGPDDGAGPPELLVVSFAERGEAFSAAAEPAGDDDYSAEESRRLRAELQGTVEELQTSNEELKASHQEVMSINEELQSTNEELEASKEEMQSLNEELVTVNAQLRTQMEEHLATSSDLQSLLTSTDIAVLFLDPALRIRRYTPAARDLVDLIAADIGRPLEALAQKFDDPHLHDDCQSVLERLIPAEREVSAARGRHYLRRVHPYRTADNRIDGVVITFVDISLRKRAEEALRASEEQFRRAIEDAPIPVIMQAEDGRVLQVSRTWTELTGYALHDVPTAVAWLTRAYGPGADAVREHMHELFTGGRKAIDVEFAIRTRAGAERLWSFSASAPGALHDGRRYLVGMALDVTDRRRAEGSLRESEGRTRLIVESAADYAIFTLGRDRTITTWSPGAAAAFGYTAAEAVGLSADVLFTPEDRAAGAPEAEVEEALRDGRAADERWHLRKDGSRFFASGVLNRLGVSGDSGFVKVARDLTDRKRMEDELRRARDELEKRVEERTAELRETQARELQAQRLATIGETITTLAHEGRNSLQRAQGCLSRLGYRLEAQPEALDLTRRTQQALEDLTRLFEDIRGYAAPIHLDVRACDARGIWRSAWAEVVAQRPGRDAGLAEEARGVALDCAADPFRLAQVFTNLFANALDASPDPAQIVVACRDAVVGDRPGLRITVRDNGPGLPPQQRQHAFEPFRTTKPQGTGLGMAIVKRIVEAHGGTIAVDEGTEGGASITFTLPRPPE